MPYQAYVDGLLVRARFREDSGNRPVEILDALVGKQRKTGIFSFKRGLLLEVRMGSGKLSIDEANYELASGDILSVYPNAKLTLENTHNELPLDIQFTLIGPTSPRE